MMMMMMMMMMIMCTGRRRIAITDMMSTIFFTYFMRSVTDRHYLRSQNEPQLLQILQQFGVGYVFKYTTLLYIRIFGTSL